MGIRVPPPEGLTAQRFCAGDAELVLFAWDVGLDLSAHAQPELDRLSAAEREVLARITRGESNVAIARARGVSARTVANQVASVLRKLRASSRLELIHRYG